MAWDIFPDFPKDILIRSMRQEKHHLPLYPSGLFVEQAQKSILLLISVTTSGAQRVLLWNRMKTT